MSEQTFYLVYDKQCPMCERYCTMVRINRTVGQLQLVDARGGGPIVDEVTALGLDIDQGMVLKVGETIYYGADAIHALSLLSSQVGWFNRFNFWLFKSTSRSKWLYPLLRSCRNIVLKLIGKSKINNLEQPGNHRF